jgi:F0F1-type ATP synthase membrane subunit a
MDCPRRSLIYFAFLCNLVSLDGYSVDSNCKHFSDVETSFRFDLSMQVFSFLFWAMKKMNKAISYNI